jgi:uncharacterized Rmd1/YagE family protein
MALYAINLFLAFHVKMYFYYYRNLLLNRLTVCSQSLHICSEYLQYSQHVQFEFVIIR